jgi:AcrR family transcriptional regulator
VRRKEDTEIAELTGRCLAAFTQAGTLDLSLDQLAQKVGASKRMLVHYFGGRESLEERVFALLEERLRTQFSAELFPAGATLHSAVMALWNRSTAPESQGALRVVMDATRRAWTSTRDQASSRDQTGSARARAFYAVQQRLWVALLLKFLPDPAAVEELLQLFQGAVQVYLVTGDREPGRRALTRMIQREMRLAHTSPGAPPSPPSPG